MSLRRIDCSVISRDEQLILIVNARGVDKRTVVKLF